MFLGRIIGGCRYAWNRPDLGGLQINEGSEAWNAIRAHA